MIEYGVVLAGGFATRLRPLSYTKPKPLFPILDKPVIDWVLERVVEIAKPVVSVRYLSHAIRNYLGTRWGDAVKIVEEDRPLGDGGAVAHVVENLGINGPALVAYGDVFTDISTKSLWEFHKRSGAAVTIALVRAPPEDVARFGVAVVSDSGRIAQFVEKPKEHVGSNLVNAGFYVFEYDALREFIKPNSGELRIARDLIPRMMRKFDVYGYIHEGLWFDIGTHSDYLRANFAALERFGAGVQSAGDAVVVQPAYVSKGVTIEPGSVIGPYAVVGGGSKIGPYARIRESVLMGGVIAGAGAYVRRSIIGDGVVLGRWARLVEAVVAEGVYIRDEVHVERGAMIGPNREVEGDVRNGEVLP
jgi:mannose-1-phosphate guanylyltransferase